MAMNQVLIRVAGSEIFLISPYSETLNWIVSSVKIILKGSYEKIVDGEKPGWKRVQGFENNSKAIDSASVIISDLLDHGWEYMNLHFYVDGHWFQKP